MLTVLFLFACFVKAYSTATRIEWGHFTSAEQTAILQAHNAFRSKLALGTYKSAAGVKFAKATNMYQLKWDFNAADEAFDALVLCPMTPTTYKGQNFYKGINVSRTGCGTKACAAWTNEFHAFGPSGYVMTVNTKQATQMAWAKSHSVGCAWANCQNGADTVMLVICRYTPEGNTAGVKAYAQGAKTCAMCPPVAAPCVKATGLCGEPLPVPDYKLFPAADQTYFLSKFNSVRSQMALGELTWDNCSWHWATNDKPNETIYWPASKATYQLKWDAGLALSAGKKLASAKYFPDPTGNYALNASVGNFGYNTNVDEWIPRRDSEGTLQQMINAAWFTWYGCFGVLKMAYHAMADPKNGTQVYEDILYTYLAGSARKIGCAYRNDTGYWGILCYTWPKGLTVGSAFYPAGTPVCSSCPSTAPCNKATGLCVLK
ncbi:unnamed protein product, partial [Mesorhabditis belari]|uniref:SCP domain-containing protein n=1 Tax=Mesorhabditis belari TaxID=2138241 RepID=A0AAF3J3U4_9BILA